MTYIRHDLPLSVYEMVSGKFSESPSLDVGGGDDPERTGVESSSSDPSAYRDLKRRRGFDGETEGEVFESSFALPLTLFAASFEGVLGATCDGVVGATCADVGVGVGLGVLVAALFALLALFAVVVFDCFEVVEGALSGLGLGLGFGSRSNPNVFSTVS